MVNDGVGKSVEAWSDPSVEAWSDPTVEAWSDLSCCAEWTTGCAEWTTL